MAASITYRKLRKYKYQLTAPYEHPGPTGIVTAAGAEVPGFIVLTKDGHLTISKGYAWDGPSGPTIDTKDFMRGSLVHDALYQLMRARKLPQETRIAADNLLRETCKADGMSAFRAWYVYRSVRAFAAKSAVPDDHEDDIFTAP